jgi:hypothetical protein
MWTGENQYSEGAGVDFWNPQSGGKRVKFAVPPQDSFADRRPAIVDLGPVRPRGRGAHKIGTEPATATTTKTTTDEPVLTSFGNVMKAFTVTVLVVCLFGAQGLTEQARSMTPGTASESATMTIGNMFVGVQNLFGLGAPWRNFEVALGHGNQFKPSKLDVVPTVTPTPTPSPTPTGTKGGHGNPPKKHKRLWPKLPVISKAHPLRIMVTGDSLPQYMVGQIQDLASSEGPVVSPAGSYQHTTFEGTGLWDPDTFAWDVQAQSETRAYHPQAVIMLMGGNDFENMVLGNRLFMAGTPSWTAEYQRRAEIVMHTFMNNGVKRLYWLSMPPSGDGGAGYAHDYHQIDVALKRAAKQVIGVHYVNINPVVTYRGRYVDYKKVDGVLTLIREPDGIHLNIAGSQLVSDAVVKVLKREWKFGWAEVRARTHPRGKHHRHHKESHSG